MARGTPKRAKREPQPGSLFPSQALARNVRAYRAIRGMKQEDVGRRMAQLGHEWTPGIVGFVERNDRAVSVDELVGLALTLSVAVGALLDPTGPDGREEFGLDFGGPAREWTPASPVVGRFLARGWAVGRIVQELTQQTGLGVVDFSPEPQHETEWEREQAKALAKAIEQEQETER